MKKLLGTKFVLIDDQVNFISEHSDLEEFIDSTFVEFIQLLNIDADYLKRQLTVIISFQKGFSAAKKEINIAPRASGKCNRLDSFTIQLRKFLLKYLLQQQWGRVFVLFWEGLPCFLSENYVRQKVIGFSCHEFCRSLMLNNNLIPIKNFFPAQNYYSLENDFRRNFISASFNGFLLERSGIESYIGFFNDFIPPDSKTYELKIHTFLEKHFGKLLDSLELEWHEFLKEKVETKPQTEQIVKGQLFDNNFSTKVTHCNICLAELLNQRFCVHCNADSQRKLKIT